MNKFTHINATSVDEAVSILRRYGSKASIIAGGTDLLGKLKDESMSSYPEAVVNLKTIPGLDFIRQEGDVLKIGALTRLADIAADPIVQSRYAALAEAARRTASTHLREMGTLGGNLCQDIRCWYYRNPNNRFPCLRKSGGRCYALEGDDRYHSIFDGSVEDGCIAVHPSDTAPALIALDARIQTSKRIVNAHNFFRVDECKTTILDDDEIVTEIHVPLPPGKSAFAKFALRKAIDFPIVNGAAMIAVSDGVVSAAHICLNAVYVIPYQATLAEQILIGQPLDEASAQAAADAAVSNARPRHRNKFMVEIARTLVKKIVLACQ
ncbi:MAG: FAD binding domain-containing protein [Anaerolineales bacterium]|nr:FAD binding domain-containing protein [Anaerolineales bacterium]MDP2977148.1 FAD binding domain-containing protein [Anaerolineales bacterium]